MTTPPLDLTALRAIANAATQSEWTSYGYRVETVPALDLHRFDVMGEMVAECDLIEEDARHIAAFDPPTVLALLDRVESAESSLARYIVERTRFGDAMAASAVPSVVDAIMRELTADSAARAEAAEQAVAAVRELHKAKHGEKPVYASDDWHAEREPIEWVKYTICANCLSTYPCPTITALDTHTPETETP